MISSWTWKEIGDGKEEHTYKTRVQSVQTGTCRRIQHGGRQQISSVQILALPLLPWPGQMASPESQFALL